MCDPATIGIIGTIGSAVGSIAPLFMGGGEQQQQQQQTPYQQDTYEPAQNQQNESGMSPEAMRQAERDRKKIAAQQQAQQGQPQSLLSGATPVPKPNYTGYDAFGAPADYNQPLLK